MSSYSWELGQCYATQQYIGGHTEKYNGRTLVIGGLTSYREKCCILNGNHLLSCKNAHNSGWVNSLVQIGGHKFCDDIIGMNKFILVNIQGTWLYTNPIRICKLI